MTNSSTNNSLTGRPSYAVYTSKAAVAKRARELGAKYFSITEGGRAFFFKTDAYCVPSSPSVFRTEDFD